MDSDWCTFCGKHVETSGHLYCSDICHHKDRISGSTDHIRSLNITSGAGTTLSNRRIATVTPVDEPPFTLRLHKRNNSVLPIMPKGYPTIRRSGIHTSLRLTVSVY
ncbi:hypothetical protein K7432_002463 [Basidiobolus ranarum]|uniref:Uncharacterized protein n=1 Tax=Basidiobolus ranarum TaxID=34480 RepID=A0ABR2W7Q3_9FUNG